MFSSPAPSSPGLFQPGFSDSPSTSRNQFRKKRKQAKLVNPARSFLDLSLKNDSPGLDSYDDSGFDFAGGSRFLAELSPDASINRPERVVHITARSPSASPPPSVQRPHEGSVAPSASPSVLNGAHTAGSTTPSRTPERTPSDSNKLAPTPSPSGFGGLNFFAPGSPLNILAPIDNTLSPMRAQVSPNKSPNRSPNKSYSPLGSIGKSPSFKRKPLPSADDVAEMERSPRIFSRDIAGDSSFEETFSTPQKMSVKKARTPGTPDSEDEVENLTQASTTFDFSRARPAFGTPDRSTTVGPSPRRIVGVNTMPSLPSTPVLRRPALSSDAFMTPARSSSYGSAQTPRSILRPFNTPATGNSVRFNSVTYFKVIERLPEFNPTSSPQENLGDEGTTALGIEPEERSEVPMVEHLSDDDLDFVPTHHNTIDSISSDGFSDEVERNTLANSHTTVNPDGTPMIIEEITQSCVSNASLEATTRWLEEFVAENKLVKKERSVSDGTQRTVSISTQRTVSTSTQRTVSSSSLAPLDMDSPIRHASPLIPAVDDTADVSNINNSSEWVVPTDLSFGNASLPRFEASVAITEMADPDATAATVRGSGIVPRRPQSLPLWTVPTIATSPPRDGEITPVGPRTRIAASKYISTTPLKHAPTSPFSPRRPTEDKENASVTVASTVTMSPPLTSPLKTSPPSLPAVSEDEEENDATAIRVEVTKQSMFGSLSHTGPSTAPSTLASLRLSRALLEDEDDRLPESPTPNKLALEGATVAALTGDISKLSLVDVSGNVSKLSFLDDSKVLAKSGSPGLSASASANRSALSTTSSAAIFEAQSMIAAQAQHIRNLEAELADMKKVQDEYVTEVTDREAALSKFLGPEDVTRMAGKVDGLRRENRELRAELTSAKKSVSEAEAKQTTTDSDRSRLEVIAREAEHEAQELRAQLADAEHAKEELQGEVNALRATHAEGVEDKLKDTEAELAAKLDQLEHFGRDAASAMERAETAETKLQTVQDEAARLGTDLEASRAECERLRAELDATKAAASSTASADLAAAHLEITEFKAQLAYESETKGELRSALADAHAEAASLRAQIADSRGVAGDAEVEARAARDEAADVASQLDRALADLESARADYDRLQEDAEVHAAAATREGVARVEAERQFGSVRDELTKAKADLAATRSEANKLSLKLKADENVRPSPVQDADSDRRVKQLQKRVASLENTQDMLNDAVKSAQMETEMYKRKLATVQGSMQLQHQRPLRSMKQTPPSARPSHPVST